jgi:hypothetical protein
MEAWFACLEVLVTSMASRMASNVKPIAFVPSDFSSQSFDLRFFYGAKFSRPLSMDEIKLGIIDDHVSRPTNDKTMVKVSTITLITKASARMQEPHGVDKRFYP